MKMSDYLEAFRGKWIMVQLLTGTGCYLNGVLKDIGEDYIVILTTEKEKPTMINIRNLVSVKEMHINEKGKPKLFG